MTAPSAPCDITTLQFSWRGRRAPWQQSLAMLRSGELKVPSVRHHLNRCPVYTQKSKTIFFVLEGLNAVATSYFGNYVFFLLRDRFGFGNLGNLSASALGGFVYMLAAWQGGRFAQRFGYFTALKTGFAGMAACLLLGGLCPSLPTLYPIDPPRPPSTNPSHDWSTVTSDWPNSSPKPPPPTRSTSSPSPRLNWATPCPHF